MPQMCTARVNVYIKLLESERATRLRKARRSQKSAVVAARLFHVGTMRCEEYLLTSMRLYCISNL
jgi:hypothetical protein